jgi:recombination protein RecA
MAKKKTVEENPLADIADELGADLLNELDTVRNWIDTGNLALNFLCSGKFFGGGIPSGKIVEIFGESSSCKTLFATNILKGCQKAGGVSVFLDAENTLNKEFAEKASHLDTSQLLVLKADSLEKAFAKLNAAIRAIRTRMGPEKPIVIVYDSIAASPSEREFKETEMTEKELEKAKDKPGDRALTCSKELRKLTPILDQHNATVIFINQVRNKIGVMYGSPETTAGGGKSLPFYATLRLRTKAEKQYKDKLGNVIGMGVTVQNKKNKVFRPHISAREMALYYDQGINPVGGLLELLIQNGRIVGSAGNYTVQEPWAGGQEIKFKSSLERNDIPVEVLLKCPALVDATDPAQVQDYINTYGSALNVEVADESKVTESDE